MFLVRLLLLSLILQVKFEHPHKFLLHYLKSLRDWISPDTWNKYPIAKTSWCILLVIFSGLCSLLEPVVDSFNFVFRISDMYYILSVFRIRTRIHSGHWIRIPIQEGKNDPQKIEKMKKFHVLKCWMFSFEG